MALPVLHSGDTGPAVAAWQYFLRGTGFQLHVTNTFDVETDANTRTFQAANGLVADGVVGNRTYAVAMTQGFAGTEPPSDDVPPRPENLQPILTDRRSEVFGTFEWQPTPTPGNPELIQILPEIPRQPPNWIKANVVSVEVPWLKETGLHRTGEVQINKRLAKSFLALWDDWQSAQLLSRIKHWDGAFATRCVRGHTYLSMHCYAAAFDMNTEFNPLGTIPVSIGELGCVRELVAAANARGWFWGGHFHGRLDGGHFEATEAALDGTPLPVLPKVRRV